MARSRPAPAHVLSVYRAQDFVASDGANRGDPLSFASELILDDIYTLPYDTRPQQLAILAGEDNHFRIAPESDVGMHRSRLVLDSALSFMSSEGGMHDTLLMVEVDAKGNVADVYLVPLAALHNAVEYQLVGIDTTTARQKFAQVACVSFTRGTHITLASGEQRLIENLNIGERVLTRDDGVQPVRWIGQTTVRAVGDVAPIKISAGTLNNDRDLFVSPDHRLFIYQRSDALGVGRAEILVKARHLVNGTSVTVMEGGFVDYFQLLFDRHQIVYAEGIAAETMLIDRRTRSVLPEDLSAVLGDVIAGHSDLPLAGLDVSEALLDRPDVAEVLRKASSS